MKQEENQATGAEQPANSRQSLGYSLHLVALQMKLRLQEEMRRAGLEVTPEQFTLLRRLWIEDGLHQNALARLTGKDRHNIHRIAAKLEAGGLITRRPDRLDRRLVRCYLTDRGRAMGDLLPGLERRVLEQAMRGFSPERARAFGRDLARIMRNLDLE